MSQTSETESQLQTHTAVLSGYGVRAEVRGGHLEVESGVGTNRSKRRFTRISGLRRVIVLGDSGMVSLDALRWLHDTGAAFVHIGRDAQVVTVGSPWAVSDVRVRRAQGLALFTGTGLTVTRELLSAKLGGQLDLLKRIEHSVEVRDEIEYALHALQSADSLTELRYAESRAAVAYWGAWRDMEVRFVGKDQGCIPKHWRTVGARQSPLTDASRKAVTPVHALLNYLYAILESEAHLAAVAVGCDPQLGILHVDKSGRSSFACDLMEPVRPHVDAFVLHLLETRSFLKSDFFETREGVCRVMPPLTEALAGTGAEWAKRVAPIAEQIAGAFAAAGTDELRILGAPAKSANFPRRYRTPITQQNRVRKSGEQAWNDRGVAKRLTIGLPARCKACGTEIPKRRAVCDGCLEAHRLRASKQGRDLQVALRAAGADKRSGAAARAKHSENSRRRSEELSAWKAANPVTPNPQAFTKEIWPHIQELSVAALMAATELSNSMCKKVRSGTLVPHPRHWDKFKDAAKK